MKSGPGIQSPVQVTLEDLYNGKTFTILHKKQVICHQCRGSGAKDANDVKTCTSCNGKGIKVG
jgi:DnaJ-class molecular chaperone